VKRLIGDLRIEVDGNITIKVIDKSSGEVLNFYRFSIDETLEDLG